MTAVYGIGRQTAKQIVASANVEQVKRAKDLSNEEFDRIREILERQYTVEGELRMQVAQNIKRLIEVGTYRGVRHTKKLPVRGQRTKTNARTKRGRRVTVGSGRKAATAKT